MAWVLWDILIPLVASFALGTLLGWSIWSWRRQNNVQRQDGSTEKASTSDIATRSVTAENALTDADADAVHFNAPAQGTRQETAAVTDMETANAVLIGERDAANQSLDDLQAEADAMQERIAELEAIAEQSSVSDTTSSDMPDPDTEDTDAVGTGPILDSVSAPLGIALHAEKLEKENAKLGLLKSDLQQLTTTLERERKARRATELELLNIKNQHDKLANEIESTVSVVDHTNAIEERDEKIISLQQQLDASTEQVAQHRETAQSPEEESEKSAESEQSSVTTQIAAEPADPQPLTVEPVVEHVEKSNNRSAAEEDDPVESEVSETQQKASTQSGYIPKSWSVPLEKPAKKERDKLTEIKGIGPVMEKMLHDCGIYYFSQVANLDDNGVEELQMQIPQFPGRIKRDKWVEQASVLQQKVHGEMA